MKSYYTAEEAIKKLDLPRSTFHYYVRSGQIPKIILPLRKQAVYPKKDIDKLVEEKTRMLETYEAKPERLAFIVPNEEELKQLVERVDRLVFYEETLILPEEQEKWQLNNPEAIHILKDTETNSVVGGVTISPLRQEALERLLELGIDETQLVPEDFQPYRTGPQDCYIIGIVTKPDLIEKFYASRLLRATLTYFIELLDRGTIIDHLYTVTGTEDGDRVAEGLGFQRLAGEKQGEHEFRHPYVLDLTVKSSVSKLVSMYLRQRKNLVRRKRRYSRDHQNRQT